MLKHSVSEKRSVSIFRCEAGDNVLGPLERASLNHGPKRVGVPASHLKKEIDLVSEALCFFKYWKMGKV
jgi:hypothetical protein